MTRDQTHNKVLNMNLHVRYVYLYGFCLSYVRLADDHHEIVDILQGYRHALPMEGG